MDENREMSRHDQLKFKLKKRISPELFECMTEEVQEYLLEADPVDIKETYLTTLLKLPWEARNEQLPDIELSYTKKLLEQTHYAMIDVKEKVLRYMACQKHLGKSYGTVLLLIGAPGVGKTSIVDSVAKAMGRPCVKISLAGASDALFLRGAQTIFHNAKHGRIVEALIRSKSFCPLILLDEIDKMGDSVEHGDPESVLLDILDSDRSKFIDNYLGFPLDLSNVIFIATANTVESLSPVLLDRLDVVELPSYTPEDKEQIVTKYIWPKLTEEYKVDVQLNAVKELIEMCPEEGVRDLERICRRICESVISKYYIDGTSINMIDSEQLKILLGPIFYK